MKTAIPKLRRRIEELKAFDVETVHARSDPRIDALEDKFDDTIVEIFGNDTAEYHRFRIHGLDRAPSNYAYPTPLPKVLEGLRRGIADTVTKLETIAQLFEEKLGDLGDSPAGRADRAFDTLNLHDEIERAAAKLFHDGHYASAVEDACKALAGLVKIRSGRHDLSGTTLMQTVFSPNNPILKFNTLNTETEKSEQLGMMFLYAGAMLALRNPRAHEIIKDDPESALEFIGLASLLAKALDRATRA